MPSLWRALALSILIVTGALIIVRAFYGPFSIVNSPMNAEGVFALAFVAWVMLGRRDSIVALQASQHLLWISVLLVLVVGVFWRSLWFPLLSDDYILVTQTARASGSLLRPFIEPGGDGSYRPVGYLLLIGSGQWAHADAFRWHLISLAVHAANMILVYTAAHFVTKNSEVAGIAAAVFALHGTRPEAVTWTAGRFDLFAAFFALAGLVAFLRESTIVSALLVGVAIMCKESAYAFPALAVAFVIAGGVRLERRLLTTLIAPAVMLAYRFILFHGPGGYVDPTTGHAQILGIRFVPTLKALFLRFWAAMMFPIDWAQRPQFYLAAATMLMVATVVTLYWLHRKSAIVLAACTLATALPAIHLLGIGPDLLGSRILYLPAVVFGLFLAVLIGSSRVIGACVVFFYAATLTHNLAIWGRVSELADRTCVAAAGQLTGAQSAAIGGIPVAIDGVNFFANGFPECVALHSTAPPKSWTIKHVPAAVESTPAERVLRWDGPTQSLR